MIVQHLLTLAVVFCFLLGDQLVASVVTRCGETEYTDYTFNEETCHITFVTDLMNSAYTNSLCREPPAPILIPSDDVPKFFTIGFPFYKSENSYCDTSYLSYSPFESIVRTNPNKNNNIEWLMEQNSLYRSLSAVTHAKANFYIKSRTGGWDRKGQVGPFFYRFPIAEEHQDIAEMLETPRILGFTKWDSTFSIAFFGFFLPKDMTSDPTIADWLSQQSGKTDFAVGADLVSACKDAMTSKSCEAKSTITSAIMRSLLFKNTNSMDARLTEAKLMSDKFSLIIEWSEYDKAKYTQNAITQSVDSCKPKLVVVVHDSNPIARGDKNNNIRAVLITFNTNLIWDSINNKLKDTFVLNSATDDWARMKNKLLFLKHVNDWNSENDAKNFYEGWSKETGFAVAITVCMCDGELTRQQGCRQYMIHPLTVDPILWNSLSLR